MEFMLFMESFNMYCFILFILSHDIAWGDTAKMRIKKALKNIANIEILENQEIWPWGD